MPGSAWRELFQQSFRDQLGTWIDRVVITLLGVFSGQTVGSAKSALNKADLRTTNYEELAIDLSDFVFMAELKHEFMHNGWTTKESQWIHGDPVLLSSTRYRHVNRFTALERLEVRHDVEKIRIYSENN